VGGRNETKFLYIHLAPEHLKGKMKDTLSLDIYNFKRRCRDICDVDQQRTRKASRKVNYSVNRPSQRKSKSNNHMNSYRYIDQYSGYQNILAIEIVIFMILESLVTL